MLIHFYNIIKFSFSFVIFWIFGTTTSVWNIFHFWRFRFLIPIKSLIPGVGHLCFGFVYEFNHMWKWPISIFLHSWNLIAQNPCCLSTNPVTLNVAFETSSIQFFKFFISLLLNWNEIMVHVINHLNLRHILQLLLICLDRFIVVNFEIFMANICTNFSDTLFII